MKIKIQSDVSMFKKMVAQICFLMMVFVFTSLLFASEENSQGKGLVFDTAYHDFGVAMEGDVLHCTFSGHNRNTHPITIKRVVSNCPCVTAVSAQNTVAPGETCVITLDLDTKDTSGFLAKQVFINTDSAITPIVTLSATVVVEAVDKKKRSSKMTWLEKLNPFKNKD